MGEITILEPRVSYLLEHLNEFVIDALFVLMALTAYLTYRTRAALFVLANYLIILAFVYIVLIYLAYSSLYIVDYHLILTVYDLLFLLLLVVTVKKHRILKIAIALEALIHAIAVIKEPFLQLGWINYNQYTFIYNSYAECRIILVSLQILGLVNGGEHGGHGDFSNRIRSHIRNAFDYFRIHTISILRVKRP